MIDATMAHDRAPEPGPPAGPLPLRLTAALIVVALAATACSSDDVGDSAGTTVTTTPATTTGPTTSGTAPTGQTIDLSVGILPAQLSALTASFSQYVNVWGVHIVATAATDDAKVTHAANVMAQYLDNDADGTPDNSAVVDALGANQAILLMGNRSDELESLDFSLLDGFSAQDLYGSETAPPGGFDAALEEVHHLLLNFGWAQVFPEQLAQSKGSGIANAMDVARGGQFDTIPNPYPPGAWYTYDDETCDYTCMITEYTYWAHTSLLGAQAGRAGEISEEWTLETPDKVRATDTAVTAILEDPNLGLPTVLPDGNYTG